MKQRPDRLFRISIIYNFLLIILLILFLIFKFGPTGSGPIGDTFGGLLSPIIGLISFYFIYITFEAQNEQLEDQKCINKVQRIHIEEQREQYHVNRITDIIYLQLERINESIKSQTFLFSGLGVDKEEKVQGYAGLYSLNETINRLLIFPELNAEEVPERLEKFIVDNLIQLIDIYENVFTAATIVDKLIEETKTDSRQIYNNLKILLALNLGDIVKNNIIEIRKYMEIHKRNSSDLDIIYTNEIRIEKLDQLVAGAYSFFNNVLDSAKDIAE